jgi:hypothetical protein
MSDTPPPKEGTTSTVNFLHASLIVAGLAAVIFYVRMDKLQGSVDQLQRQLAAAQSELTLLRPLAEKARELPVKLTFRKAVLGDGYVLGIHNTSRQSLSLSVKLTNPTFKRTKSFRVDLDGGATKEIGHAEGWTAMANDSVEVVCAGFDPFRSQLKP